MRKIILTALIAAAGVTPSLASAQTHELRGDRQDIRQERRDLRDAQRYGDRRDVRDARHDLRDAQREYRGDWRDYRDHNRGLYARGNWRAPFRYQRFSAGAPIRATYYAPRYFIADPGRYHLPAASGPTRWVRHYDDALLVNVRTGRVVQVINGFYW